MWWWRGWLTRRWRRWDLCAKKFSSGNNLKMHMNEISRWVKALFLEKVLTYADVVQKFSHVGSVWRSTWPLLTEERPSACELCAKTFSSGNNLKMHMKAHAEWRPSQCRHWRNCDKYCIKITVLKIHKLFHSGEKSPKCNSTQEKSPWPCEQCVKMSFYLKQHQDTL